MPKSAKYLLIGSIEPYSGKSATVIGIAHELKRQGLDITYGKPLGADLSASDAEEKDEDVEFVAQTLDLPKEDLQSVLLPLNKETIERRIAEADQTNYQQQLQTFLAQQSGDLVLLEGPGTLDEGLLFGLSLRQIAEIADASVVLVTRFRSPLVVEALLSAQQRLGDRLIGVLINDVLPESLNSVETKVKPYLEQHDIPVLGILPRNNVLRSVSVGELVRKLNAEVLCCADRLDLMVESLSIGAMNVNSALKYFRKGCNMAVVTGGDRTDIQLAALETSTHCLILTGHLPPAPEILERAEDLEIPILSVDLDTLTTVEIIDLAFGQVRVHEPIKVECIFHLMENYFDVKQLMKQLGLQPAITA